MFGSKSFAALARSPRLNASYPRRILSTFCSEIRPHLPSGWAISCVVCDERQVVMASPATSPTQYLADSGGVGVSVLLRRPHLCLNRCRGRRRPGMDAAQIGHRDSRFTLNVYTDVHNRRQSAAERVGGLIRASEWAPLGHGRFCRCSARSERAGFGPRIALRGISSVGRAPALQAGGRRFESGMLHRVARVVLRARLGSNPGCLFKVLT
jgi:hypothetical protein